MPCIGLTDSDVGAAGAKLSLRLLSQLRRPTNQDAISNPDSLQLRKLPHQSRLMKVQSPEEQRNLLLNRIQTRNRNQIHQSKRKWRTSKPLKLRNRLPLKTMRNLHAHLQRQHHAQQGSSLITMVGFQLQTTHLAAQQSIQSMRPSLTSQMPNFKK